MTNKKQLNITLNNNEVPDILKVIISSWDILKILKTDKCDISTIAKKLKQTEANISIKIKKLQKLGLVKCIFEPAQHGVRKVCILEPIEIKIDI